MNGIYLWEADIPQVDDAEPARIPEGLPPGWLADLKALGPWDNVPPLANGLDGRWRRAAGSALESPVVISPACSSCLDLAWNLIRAGALPEWASVMAISQRAGRGRQGRSWESPAGNIYAALHLPDPGPLWRDSLPLAVAVMIAGSMSETGAELLVKWPNDLLLAGMKVGGILIEERSGSVLAGIGLNLISAPPAARLRREQSIPAGFLTGHGYAFTPLALWRHLSESCRRGFGNLWVGGSPSRFSGMAERCMAYLNKDVIVSPSGGEPEFRATVLGTDSRGRLRVHTERGEMLLASASIFPVTA